MLGWILIVSLLSISIMIAYTGFIEYRRKKRRMKELQRSIARKLEQRDRGIY